MVFADRKRRAKRKEEQRLEREAELSGERQKRADVSPEACDRMSDTRRRVTGGRTRQEEEEPEEEGRQAVTIVEERRDRRRGEQSDERTWDVATHGRGE
ncbi:hypothetical protein MCOR25_007298 [Pyricularia grisea]|uniref:Uncharacterized protein n=1 Tax=Pyricularia grisea TaxID=148305 RepID=A0A6P8B694_PYRGI|nr:hypothetical protein PgNI_05404 [Pyricularia grisea]KAI6358614.1 hypothetical protein MCOR25_007298 [Pyricularia grisea]TLD10832.1 hypothetical protein PgNI_05404 [Pyricularia grisea]